MVCSVMLLPELLRDDAREIDGVAVDDDLAHAWAGLVTFEVIVLSLSWGSRKSVRFDIRCLDDPCPLRDLIVDARTELGRRAADRHIADLEQPVT